MSGNRLKKQEMPEVRGEVQHPDEAATAPRRKRSSGSSWKWLKRFNVFDWFDRNQIVNNMPFILYITLLIMCYIANSYNTERIIREIDKTKLELREKSAEFISTRSQLMFESKQSAVAQSAAPYGLKESTEPPHTLLITDNAKTSSKD